MDDLTGPARALRALPPSCGPVRLIAVDGHAGSGKTTFAAHLAAALGAAPVLHLDDLATHRELFDWVPRFTRQVLDPLARGEAARYTPYDWVLRRFLPPRELPTAPVVVVEGVGAGRRALRPALSALLWMDRDATASWERGRLRDGPGLAEFWDEWTRSETRHFAADPSRPAADALVREVPRTPGRPAGYAWTPDPRSDSFRRGIARAGEPSDHPA